MLEPLDEPNAIPISDFAWVRATFVSFDVVTGHPNGNRNEVARSGAMSVTISYGERSLEIGDELAVWIHD